MESGKEQNTNEEIQLLKTKITEKTKVKLSVYKNLENFFSQLRDEAKKLSTILSDSFKDMDPPIAVSFAESPPFEFRMVVGGDTLVAVMQSNVVSFDESSPILKQPYFKAQKPHIFFGQILFYNFLTDSFQFNRYDDLGYLVGRAFIDVKGNFMVEGDRRLHYAFSSFKDCPCKASNASMLMIKALNAVLDNDLVAPEFQALELITLGQKENYSISANKASKIGFKAFSESQNIE